MQRQVLWSCREAGHTLRTLCRHGIRRIWGLAFRNSFIILVCVLIGAVLIGSMLAYVLSRFKFFGNGLIRNLFLFASLLPRYRDAGIGLPDYVYTGMDQQPAGLYRADVLVRTLSPSTSSSSFLRIFLHHWMRRRSWTDVLISEYFSGFCFRF